MRTRPELDAADIRALMAAGRAEAERQGFAVTIAIVDQGGVLLALERLDGARLHTPEAATLKARTAAIVRSPTEDLQKAVSADPALLAFPGRLSLTGGMPLRHGDVVVGGIGSSGGEPADDVAVCRAVIVALERMSEARL